MSYYNQRIQANRMIDKMHNKGIGTDEICYQIDSLYGFGDRFVKRRITLLEKLEKKEYEKVQNE